MILHSDFKTISSCSEISRRGLLGNASFGKNLLFCICPCKRELTNFNLNCFLHLNSSRNVKRLDFDVVYRKKKCKMVHVSASTSTNENHSVIGGASIGARRTVLSSLSNESSNDDELGGRVEASSSYREGSATSSSSGSNSNFASFQEDPFVENLRTQLGVMHPIPSPPMNRGILGLFAFFFFVGVVFDKVWTSRKSRNGNRNDGVDVRGGKGRGAGMWPQVPSLSMFLEKDLQRKESVEWVNMVLGKLWKVYRGGIENWLIGLLQPVIDNLKKPDYVERVEIKQFSLGDEPLSVRSVERRTSRRANDLQYQIGLRYTGGARMLLMLSLKFGIIPIVVPVGVRNFDIDGELWVKLRLIPTEPFVGAVSWAFVSLPKIKFDLSPFRLFNVMQFRSSQCF
ncbi:hypothetical protein Leryth_016754 [Lithospermum erythrorhizon]|nr:hypothetical protein Leryth_016754 [Lithospermum erythrorhizon]